MALLRYLWPGTVDVPCMLARRAAVEPREPVRGQGRRASGGRCPVADPRAKLRAPRGDIFPAGPPAPASAGGSEAGLGTGGGPRTPPWGAPRLAGGGVTSHPGCRGHRRCGNLSVAEERGLPGPPTRAPPARSGCAGRRHPRAVAETTAVPGTCGRPCQAPGATPPLPGGAETRTDMLLPFPAPSELRGVGEAGPGRCTEEPPSRGRTGPEAGALGPARGWRAGRPRHTGRREGGQPAGRRPSPAPPRPGPAQLRRPGRAGWAQRPDPGRPRFEAGNGWPGPGRPALRLCDCGGLT